MSTNDCGKTFLFKLNDSSMYSANFYYDLKSTFGDKVLNWVANLIQLLKVTELGSRAFLCVVNHDAVVTARAGS